LDWSVTVYEQLARDHRSEPLYRYRLAIVLSTLGIFQRQGGDPDSVRSYERSLAIRRDLARQNPTSRRHQNFLAHGILFVAIDRAVAGRLVEALASIQEAERIAKPFPDDDPLTAYSLACAYAQCSAAARRRERAAAPTARAESESHADRAMDALRRALAGG